MVCPQCSYENPETSVQCAKCTTPLPLSDQTLATGGQGWSVPAADGVVSNNALVQLSPGASVGSRYEIVRLLGQGGMGTVYEVEDTTVGKRYVLKTLHAHLRDRKEIPS